MSGWSWLLQAAGFFVQDLNLTIVPGKPQLQSCVHTRAIHRLSKYAVQKRNSVTDGDMIIEDLCLLG